MVLPVDVPYSHFLARYARMVEDVKPSLKQMLSVDIEERWLILHLHRLRGANASSRMVAALNAFEKVQRHASEAARTSFDRAQCFWRVLLTSDLVVSRQPSAMVESAVRILETTTPRLLLDVSGRVITSELLDGIESFLATAYESRHLNHSRRPVVVGLRFTKSRLRTEQLWLLMQMLERLYARKHESQEPPLKNRAFAIGYLDLGSNGLSAMELEVVAEIMKHNASYDIQQLILENVCARSLTNEAHMSFSMLMATVFDVDTILHGGEERSKLYLKEGFALKHLSLAKNDLGSDQYAAIFSALRHSKAVEDLCLASTLSLVNARDRELCWRWIAFGLTRARDGYSEPKRWALNRLDLSDNPLFPMDVDSFSRALQNPAAELLRNEDYASERLEDMNLWAKIAATTRIFSAPDTESRWLFMIDIERKLEVLYILDDWICVVVPGFGCGWVHTESISISEQITCQSTHASSSESVLSELVMNRMQQSETTMPAAIALLQTIGSGLSHLSLQHNTMAGAHFAAILESCPNLVHLDLEGCRINDIEPLVRALEQPRTRQQLRSVNLNANLIGYIGATNLAFTLRSPPFPALETLRLAKNPIGLHGVLGMHTVLGLNKTLSTFEADFPDEESSGEEHLAACRSMDTAFQHEKLRIIPLNVGMKLAFLSVMRCSTFADSSFAQSQLPVLDTCVINHVFEYAAAQINRCIVWRRS